MDNRVLRIIVFDDEITVPLGQHDNRHAKTSAQIKELSFQEVAETSVA